MVIRYYSSSAQPSTALQFSGGLLDVISAPQLFELKRTRCVLKAVLVTFRRSRTRCRSLVALISKHIGHLARCGRERGVSKGVNGLAMASRGRGGGPPAPIQHLRIRERRSTSPKPNPPRDVTDDQRASRLAASWRKLGVFHVPDPTTLLRANKRQTKKVPPPRLDARLLRVMLDNEIVRAGIVGSTLLLLAIFVLPAGGVWQPLALRLLHVLLAAHAIEAIFAMYVASRELHLPLRDAAAWAMLIAVLGMPATRWLLRLRPTSKRTQLSVAAGRSITLFGHSIRLRRYFAPSGGGDPPQWKPHLRCWSHVVMLAREVAHPGLRSPMITLHMSSNLLWQFLTVSPRVERVFKAVDLATIMPMVLSVMAGLAATPAQEAELVRAAMGVLCLTIGGALFAPAWNIATQAIGLVCSLTFYSRLQVRDVATEDALAASLVHFACYVSCYLVHVAATARDVAGLGGLTDTVRARHAKSPIRRALLDTLTLYDVSHWFCVAAHAALTEARARHAP